MKLHSLAWAWYSSYKTILYSWAVLGSQLVEWLLLTLEIRGSNPDIAKIFIYQLHNRIDKNKEKEAGNDPSLKNQLY